MIEEEVIGSQSEESEESETSYNDALKAFGVEPEVKTEETEEKPTPAIEKAEPKKLTVKYNKEDVEIEEDKIPELVEKGMNLDKVRNQKNEYEKALDRVAKQQGYKDHAELIANLDRIELEKEQQQKDQFDQMKQKIIEDLVYNGVDEQTAREYAENNPLVKEARIALQERDRVRQEQQAQSMEQQRLAGWQELYNAFPDIAEDAKKFSEGKRADFYTPEMEAMVNQGYKPIDAYKLAHMNRLQTQTKKATEQRIIKEQHLGLRSKVETTSAPDNEPQVPKALADAFAAFGLPVESAKKYVKK
jgi:hypothetical protein